MKKLLLFLILTSSAMAVRAQEVVIGVNFDTYFNNCEFGNNPPMGYGLEGESGTLFAARLLPKIGLKWEQKNSLVFGVDMYQNFGEKNKGFFTQVKPVVYYQLHTNKVRAVAGIFTRDMTHSDEYSAAFFTGGYRFVNNRMNGFLAQYNSGPSYVEFVCDWEGMYSIESREKFRILSSARHYFKHLYYGYNLTLFHFAHQKNNPNASIVDFILVNPCVGVKFNAFFDFDVKLGLLQTMQRDRAQADGWHTPGMGEFYFKISRWGVSLENQLFVGQNIFPFYAGHQLEDGTAIPYGHGVYPGLGYFFSVKDFYNCATLSYSKRFFNDTLSVTAKLMGHHDGNSFGTQQMLHVGVRFLKSAYDSKNHKR